jgi:hypothetical protein
MEFITRTKNYVNNPKNLDNLKLNKLQGKDCLYNFKFFFSSSTECIMIILQKKISKYLC